MSITRWDPFREMVSLREAMNQLLEQSFIGSSATTGTRAQGLALDVAERGDAYEVIASLPGVQPEDIHCSIQGDTLTIRAESKQEQERQGENYLLRERRSGVVQRSLALPATIDADAVEANYEQGVLTLHLPKSRASQPRRIEVRAGRLPSLEEQTPGLDREQARQTESDARAYFEQQNQERSSAETSERADRREERQQER